MTATGRPRASLPAGATVAGIWAHPDDEAYLAAGLMLRAARSGGRVACLHATLGEHGTEDPETWPPELLGPRRRTELAQAMSILGVAEHHQLDLPDGGLSEVADEAVVPQIAAMLRREQPDLVVTFGPDGITGHPDHRTVSRWATSAWQQVGSGELLYAVTTASFVTRFDETHRRVGMAEAFVGAVDDHEVDLALALDGEELSAKRAALAAHATQTTALADAMGEETYRQWIEVETFRRPAHARPAHRAAGPDPQGAARPA